jgi:nucleoid-associated protein YgaU
LANDTVKLKGFGTFKLQWNEPRKSVDVNTGEEILIEGYNKVVFTPDAELKDLVNEPYAHLEPVLLTEEGEETATVNVNADDSSEQTAVPLKLFNEQANEIKDILSEINSLSKKDEMEEKNEIEEKEEKVEMDEKNEKVEKVKKNVKEEKVKKNEKELNRKNIPVPSENFQRTISKSPPERKSRYNNKKTLDYFFIGAMLGGLLIYILIDFNVFSDIAMHLKALRTRSVPAPEYYQPIDITPAPVDTIPLDTLSAQLADSTEIDETAVDENTEPVDELQVLFDQPRVYKEFIATEEVIPGSRLTRISERHYGVKEFWVYIYEANKDKFNTPDQITTGAILKIPKLNPVLADKNNPRCMEYALKLHDIYLKK